MNTPVVLEAQNLKKYYPVKKLFKPTLYVKALDGVSFTLKKGKTLAVVGESGCGKSTLARVLMGLELPTDGIVKIDQKESAQLSKKDRVAKIQMVFQDPYSSIHARKRAWEIVSEPLLVNRKFSTDTRRKAALEMMVRVGLRADQMDRYPHMLSGGQRQRLVIARSLILEPEILICDEPVSALDVSIQAQVINLLLDLQDQLKLSYVFISHDLTLVRHIADDVMVMYLGRVVEQGSVQQIFSNPQHPYTRALLASSPHQILKSDTERVVLQGELPSPLDPPTGCALHERCPFAKPECSQKTPELMSAQERLVACHLFGF